MARIAKVSASLPQAANGRLEPSISPDRVPHIGQIDNVSPAKRGLCDRRTTAQTVTDRL